MHGNGLSSKTPGNNEPALAGDTPMFLWIIWGLFRGDQYVSWAYLVKFYLTLKLHLSMVYIIFVSTFLSYS